jgi:hypothetical protein
VLQICPSRPRTACHGAPFAGLDPRILTNHDAGLRNTAQYPSTTSRVIKTSSRPSTNSSTRIGYPTSSSTGRRAQARRRQSWPLPAESTVPRTCARWCLS